MNARNAKRNHQLKDILSVLRCSGKRGATTLDIGSYSNSRAVSTCVSELRHNGYDIECRRVDKIDGTRVYRYFLHR